MDMATHDIVLGTPWLRKHNPVVNWKTGVLTFRGCNCMVAVKPTHRQRMMVDEIREANNVEEIGLQKSNRILVLGPNSHDTDQEGPSGQQAESEDGLHAPAVYPKEYKKFAQLFREEEGTNTLPRH